MARNADETRRKLLDGALELWAKHGYSSVTLADINNRAGQRNASALHYHFRSRDGLITALFELHVPQIRARRAELLAVALDSDDIRPAAEAMVLPLGELVLGDWRDRAFIRLSADLLSSSSRANLNWLMGDTAIDEVTSLIRERLTDIPPTITSSRLQVAGNAFVHAAADYSRRRDQKRGRGGNPMFFLTNLVDMTLGSLTAPVSEAAARELENEEREERDSAGKLARRAAGGATRPRSGPRSVAQRSA